MNLNQALKITLLIVILVEETKSVGRKRNCKINIDADIEDLTKKINKVNANNVEKFLF